MRLYQASTLPGETFARVQLSLGNETDVLVAVSVNVVTVGPPTGARTVHVRILDADFNQIMASRGPRNQGANQNWWYYCYGGAPFDHSGSGNDENWMPWPGRYTIPPGGYVEATLVNGHGPNDTIRLYVQTE